MEYPNDMKNRLRRAEGQLASVLRMMEEGRECSDIVTQLSAVKSALDKTVGVVVSANLEMCVRESVQNGAQDVDKLVQDAVTLLIKSR
ncbi:metal-sensitive transcriptional regulator [Chryseomicrobium sp. FSL W7-1435]|uniref:metal-sensitive transcriptional regulator n=1 Tax=Chryseomicrobium sp. FSL W7-1435 TaxID=2921704 RepID=UPI00315A7F7A